MNRVDGKVAMVTGGGAGIGRVICQMLADAGAQVLVTGRHLESVEETVKMIVDSGGEAIAIKLDVTNEMDWENAMALSLKHFKALNILVNNAGIYTAEGCEDISLDDWKSTIQINLEGTFLGIRHAIRTMKENKVGNSIINISSGAGLSADPPAAYCTSKAAVMMLSKCAALECGKKGYNIRVNTVCPGDINGGIGHEIKAMEKYQEILSEHIPLGRLGEMADIAKAVLFLASEDSKYMTGSDMVIDGGFTASGSGGTRTHLDRQMEKFAQSYLAQN